MLSRVGVPLSLSFALVIAMHCPAKAQYCPVVQHIGPHDVSPKPLSQLGDETAAGPAVVEVCEGTALAAAETRTEKEDGTGDSEVEGTSVLASMENLLGDASQQSVPPLSSGRFLSQQ